MNKPAEEELHLYDRAEATIEDLPLQDGGSERVVRLRFRTSVLAARGESIGVTPWVILPLIALDRLSEQLAALSEAAKRWQPGNEFPSIGTTIGVLTSRHDEDQ